MVKKLNFFPLVCFCVGTSLGSGVFSIAGDFAQNGSHTFSVLIGWGVTFIGMLGLALCFYTLSYVKPKLKSGIYSYARAGFGEYIGFNSAWGYWISCVLCVAAYLYLVMETLGHYIPAFEPRQLYAPILLSLFLIWFLSFLILKGVTQAIRLNMFVVLVKCVPIVVVPLAIIFCRSFDIGIFMQNFAGDGSMSLFEQVKGTLTLTVWIFIGIEGTVVISGRAKKNKDVGRATFLTFVILFALYFTISFLSMGVMPVKELAALQNPSLGGLLTYATGNKWGGAFVDFSLLISVGGAFFSWLVLAVDSIYAPAKMGSFPNFLTIKNKFNSPKWSVVVTAIAISLVIVFAFVSNSSFQLCYTFSTITIIIPYTLCAFYLMKLIFNGSINYKNRRNKYLIVIICFVAIVYSFWMLYAPGLNYLFMSSAFYLPGTILFVYNCKKKGRKIFTCVLDVVVLLVIIFLFAASIPCFIVNFGC